MALVRAFYGYGESAGYFTKNYSLRRAGWLDRPAGVMDSRNCNFNCLSVYPPSFEGGFRGSYFDRCVVRRGRTQITVFFLANGRTWPRNIFSTQRSRCHAMVRFLVSRSQCSASVSRSRTFGPCRLFTSTKKSLYQVLLSNKLLTLNYLITKF